MGDMSDSAAKRGAPPDGADGAPGRCVDGLVFHDWPSPLTLTPYMSAAHRRLVERTELSAILGPLRLSAKWLYEHPVAGASGGACTFESVRAELLDAGARRRVVLGYHDGLLATAYPTYYVARAAVTAANDWTIDTWLSRDERLFGLILISTASPRDAAAEICRVGQHPQMVGVAMGANTLGRPFGDQIYDPIFRASAELDLPLVVQVGSDGVTDQNVLPLAGGAPLTFGEYSALGAQSLMGHAASFIGESVFDRFPRLRILLVGGGASWIPGTLWRLDQWHKSYPMGAPWLTRLPSEYFVDHFWVGTVSLESTPGGPRLAQLLSTVDGLASRLLYTSGYPGWQAEEPWDLARRLPEDLHASVFCEAADAFFRWPSTGSPSDGPANASAPGREAAEAPV
jgi:predicted TIM-barrel fold metal-dependent hydrolase